MGLRDGTNIQEAQPKLRKGKEKPLYYISEKSLWDGNAPFREGG